MTIHSLGFWVFPVPQVLFFNSRFVQSLFAMGAWSSVGFHPDLMLLTILKFMILHWNREECEMLCYFQPNIAVSYQNINRALPAFLKVRGEAPHAADVCVLCRTILQAVLGWAIPLVLGVRGERASRHAFVKERRLLARPITVAEIVEQSAVAIVHMMSSVALVAAIFDLFPALEHLPTLLVTGESLDEGFKGRL
eukprot:jgi/Botrbrau1/11187/Bobra.0214s0012.1